MLRPETLDIQAGGTYVHLVAEGGVGAVLELALVVCGVAEAEASQRRGEVPLGRTIVQTETPAPTRHTHTHDKLSDKSNFNGTQLSLR